MRFDLLTTGGRTFGGDIASLTLTTQNGLITVLPTHEPLMTAVVAGPVYAKVAGGNEEVFVAHGGILEVARTSVSLLTDEAEPAEGLIEAEIEAALAEAKRRRELAKNARQLALAQHSIDRHSVRLGVARTYRLRSVRHR